MTKKLISLLLMLGLTTGAVVPAMAEELPEETAAESSEVQMDDVIADEYAVEKGDELELDTPEPLEELQTEKELHDSVWSKQMMENAPYKVNWVKGHRILFQNIQEYKNAKYGQGVIYNSACGPSAAANAVYSMGVADISIKDMAAIAVNCGARYNGGTNEGTLLNYLGKKYGFSYTTTSSCTSLRKHVEAGNIAIVHAGDGYPLFTYAGHFMVAVGVEGTGYTTGKVTMLDSFWTSDKFSVVAVNKQGKRADRKKNVKVLGTGLVQCTFEQLDKACSDRSPEFYLLKTKNPIVRTALAKGDAPYTDVYTDKWYYNDVITAYKNKLMTGTSGDKFSPNAHMTRAMAVAVLYNMAGKPDVTGKDLFGDVKSKDWYYKAVEWAAQKGIVSGISNGVFAPGAEITREQLVTMMYNAAGKPKTTQSLSRYADAQSVSGWAATPMKWAVEHGVINGTASGSTTKLNPEASATRAETAAIFNRYAKSRNG